MHTNIRERARTEGGFTLIELLVVMIIISILMAVAIPTFLSQKNSAQKSKVTSNIKQIVNAIESCAQNNPDGSYTGCVTLGADNTTAGNLKTFEKGLTGLVQGNQVTQYQVVGVGTVPFQGYQVAGSIKDGDRTVWFAERHQEDGNLLKICGSGAPSTATGTGVGAIAGAAVAGSRTCTTGSWG